MAGDDAVLAVDQDRVGPAERLDGGGDLLDLGRRVGPGVAGIRDQLIQGAVLDGEVEAGEIASSAGLLGPSLDCGLCRLFGGHLRACSGLESFVVFGFAGCQGGDTPLPISRFYTWRGQHRSPLERSQVSDPPPGPFSLSPGLVELCPLSHIAASFVYSAALRRTTLLYARRRFICRAAGTMLLFLLDLLRLVSGSARAASRLRPGSPGSADPAGPDLVGAPPLPTRRSP